VDQSGNAARADSTASATSAAPPPGVTAKTSPVAGLQTSAVGGASLGQDRPLTKLATRSATGATGGINDELLKAFRIHVYPQHKRFISS
jgi:hypothetical protein